jgi:hypothetical protein
MQRPSIWLMLAIVLASLLFLREPRLQRYDEGFLRWLLRNSRPIGSAIPLAIVDVNKESGTEKKETKPAPAIPPAPSPLEFALFLQAALEFKPTVVAFEPILQWDEKNKDQEQIFVDQAMRVPKLVTAAELTGTPDLDAPVVDMPGFTQVTGRRGDLATFSGISRQPDEDVRLISTLGFTNLPNDVADEIHVPLLFQYRGEVIPSFALQTVLFWMRIAPAEVKIDLGSFIYLPNGRKIPLLPDGSALINPNAAKRARHFHLNEFLLAAQQHENKSSTPGQVENLGDDIILARTPRDRISTDGIFAATIATIQSNSFVRRVSWIFDCIFIVLLVIASGFVRRFSRIDIVLIAIAITAAYCLAGFGLVSRWAIWLPGVLPLSATWLVAAFCLFAPRSKDDPDLPAIAPSPPSP